MIRPSVLLSVLVLGTALSGPSSGQVVVRPEPGFGPRANPLKGWCPSVSAGPITLPYSMVYHNVSWKELEPTQGQYDFDAWERRAWFVPEGRGKHVVFRPFVDYPGKPSGLPDWLKDRVKLTPYPDHGGGLSPDYESPALVEGLERLIAALGKRYDTDPRVAFIELGLLGFWGEWHTWPVDRLKPSVSTEKRVIDAYHKAFPNVGLMARSARDDAGTRDWLGFHDDMFPEDTDNGQDWSFLSGIRKSGRADNWKRAPIGGEMVPGAARKWTGEGFQQSMDMVERGHFSWIGPYCPALDRKLQFSQRPQALVLKMGYQFRWEEFRFPAQIEKGKPCSVELIGVNEGVAPFYKDWAVELTLIPEQFEPVGRTRLAVDLRTWLPGAIRVKSTATFQAPAGRYSLALGIIDPMTGRPAVEFANKGENRGGWFVLGAVEVVELAR